MDECLALRFAAAAGTLSPDDYDAVRDYETDVPLWSTGQEAASHGLRAVRTPGEAARRMIDRLDAKRRRSR